MVGVCNLKKCFGSNLAVDIEDFVINDGEILGLVGNNGAGKTTLFRLMLDLIKTDDGKVEYTLNPSETSDRLRGESEGKQTWNPSETEEWKHHVGAYIDDSFLIDFLTPEEYFDFVAKVSGLDKDTLSSKLSTFSSFMAGEILGQKKLIRNFSAGNKQKIGIISALLHQPKVVILDEPFNFLDPSSQNNLKKLLLKYNEETGATILVSSHNLQHTVEISTRVTLMEHGKIIKDLRNENQSAESELESYFNL